MSITTITSFSKFVTVNLKPLLLNFSVLLLALLIGVLTDSVAAQNSSARAKAEAYLDSAYTQYSIYTLEGQRKADTALMIDPTFAAAWQQKAMPHLKNGDFPHWIELIDKAVRLDSARWLDYRAFCKIVFMKDYDGGLQDINRAQKRLPKEKLFVMDHTYDYWRSLCYMETGRLDSALFFMQKSIDEQVKDRGLEWTHYGDLFYLGVLFFDKGQIGKAEYYIDASLKKSGSFPDALYYKTLILLQLGKKGEALEVFNRLVIAREKGYRMNEDNEIYANYPRQIGEGEVDDLRKKLEF
jgi:tetratricopeptide (TPR) repeat protein